jgi:hypothetical protein
MSASHQSQAMLGTGPCSHQPREPLPLWHTTNNKAAEGHQQQHGQARYCCIAGVCCAAGWTSIRAVHTMQHVGGFGSAQAPPPITSS